MSKTLLNLTLAGCFAGLFSACQDKAREPQPAIESTPLVVTYPSEDPDKQYIEQKRAKASLQLLADNGWERPTFEFTIDAVRQLDVPVDTVVVYKSFRTGLGPFTYHPRVELARIAANQLPVTLSYRSNQLLDKLQRITGNPNTMLYFINRDPNTNFDMVRNETAVVFTFDCIRQNGQRIQITPTTKQVIATQSVSIIDGPQAEAPYAVVALVRDKF